MRNKEVYMKNKMISILLAAVLTVTLFTGCAKNTGGASSTDLVTAASLVDNAAVLEKSIGADGKWIIALTKNITTDKELTMEGDLKNGKTDSSGNETLQRKLALYTQDDDRNITNRFTLAAKKLTVKSANASIQHGTFKGDIYVAVNNFQLIDTDVDGNVYFLSEEYKSSFVMDDESSVTGVQEVKTN